MLIRAQLPVSTCVYTPPLVFECIFQQLSSCAMEKALNLKKLQIINCKEACSTSITLKPYKISTFFSMHEPIDFFLILIQTPKVLVLFFHKDIMYLFSTIIYVRTMLNQQSLKLLLNLWHRRNTAHCWCLFQWYRDNATHFPVFFHCDMRQNCTFIRYVCYVPCFNRQMIKSTLLSIAKYLFYPSPGCSLDRSSIQ